MDVNLNETAVARCGCWGEHMSRYHVWRNPSGSTQIVKVGWSWPAFLFGGLWALYKRMTLLGVGMLLLAWILNTLAVLAFGEGEEDVGLLISASLFGIIFGANGNTWREKYLTVRGFTLVKTIRRSPFRALASYFPPIVRRLWNDPVWSKVIATLVIGALSGILLLVRHTSVEESPLVGEYLVPTCHRATIMGAVEPHGYEAFAWFEWGDTPDLGRTTPKQRFTKNAKYYQHLVGLTENTTYYYKAVFANRYGRAEGRVYTVTTSRC